MTDELAAGLAEVDTQDEIPEGFVIRAGDEPPPRRPDAGAEGLVEPDRSDNAYPQSVELARETQVPAGSRTHEPPVTSLALVPDEPGEFVRRLSQRPAPDWTRRAPRLAVNL